jgi:hypothetical protein
MAELKASLGILVNASMTQSETRIPFQQPVLGVEKREEFAHLQSAMERIFAAGSVEKFLRLLRSKGVPIRDFDRVLRETLLERADATLAKSGKSARQWYDAVSVSDQAQIREFYLTALEAVDLPLREKFKQLYRYY